MPRLLPPLPHSLYLALRLIFVSRLTPVLVLLIAAVAFLLHAVLPHEPSQADIVQAFNGYETKNFTAGPLPGIANIVKKACNPALEAGGYLCEVQYTQQMLRPGGPAQYTRVFRLFQVEGGAWGQQVWNDDVKRYAIQSAAEYEQWRDGHAFWTLILYTVASVVGALLLCGALPAVPWNAPGMNTRATPRVGRAIPSGSSAADGVARIITDGANNLTPAAAMGLFAVALGIGGFMLGSWLLPQLFIDLRVMRWIERLCLLTSGISMAAIGFCLPMLIVRLLATGVVVFVMYAVLVLPVMWIATGSSPSQTLSKNADSFERLFVSDKPKSTASATAGAPKLKAGSAPPQRQGFEGYRQVLAW